MIAVLEPKLEEAERTRARAEAPPPDIRDAYQGELEKIHTLLGDPDLVHEAHTLLATLINQIRLRPDETAVDSIAAENLTDLGRFLLAGRNPGQEPVDLRLLTAARLLTVNHWSERQWRPGHRDGP